MRSTRTTRSLDQNSGIIAAEDDEIDAGVQHIELTTLSPKRILQDELSPASCFFSFAAMNFVVDDLERYPDFFKDDSVMQLPQAGSYIGADGIKEYVGFLTPISPFIAKLTAKAESVSLTGIDTDKGLCEFVVFQQHQFEMEPWVTPYDAYNSTAMTKIYFSPSEGCIRRINVFFNENFLELFFGLLLNTDQTRSFAVCSVMQI